MAAIMAEEVDAGTYEYGNGLYAVSDLQRVFDAVSDPNDWKGPIAVVVPGELVNAVCAAISYYTHRGGPGRSSPTATQEGSEMKLMDGTYDCRRPAPSTPWGPAQTVKTLAEGIIHVTTASHGGIFLSRARMDALPEALRGLNIYGGGAWFEEDCEWAIPAIVFPAVFLERWGSESVQAAWDTLKAWYPEAYHWAIGWDRRKESRLHSGPIGGGRDAVHRPSKEDREMATPRPPHFDSFGQMFPHVGDFLYDLCVENGVDAQGITDDTYNVVRRLQEVVDADEEYHLAVFLSELEMSLRPDA